ncbi:hypothetical protein SBF1_3660006 [Candidatus Desulfosporosinus infrequens]|uniref:Uncharacterized protein n=1 Tax=Candidatus Desulfosporosinus infrequens TaxID=2043169 RepID=A0A2U3L444_9FIRM|nr:hypothetical protein SBF1_3660006 [Candidatus Desulfosporosinus infrequens]
MDRFFTSFRMTSEKTKSLLLLHNIIQLRNNQWIMRGRQIATIGQKDHLPQFGHFNNLGPPSMRGPKIY